MTGKKLIQKILNSSYLKWLVVFILPITFVYKHINTTFTGADFQIKFNEINPINNFLAWDSSYLGESSFTVFKLVNSFFLYISYLLGGFENTSVFYLYIVILIYLLAYLYLFKSLALAYKFDHKNNLIIVTLLISVVFSPIILGYLANYLTVGFIRSFAFSVFALAFIFRFVDTQKYFYLILSVLSVFFVSQIQLLLFYIALLSIFFLFLPIKIKDIFLFLFLVVITNLYLFYPIISSLLNPNTVSLSADGTYIDHIFNWYNNSIFVLNTLIFSVYPNSKLFNFFPESIFYIIYSLFYGLILLALYFVYNIKGYLRRPIVGLLFVLVSAFLFAFGMNYTFSSFFEYAWYHLPLIQFFKSFTQILGLSFVFFISLLFISLGIVYKKFPKVASIFLTLILLANIFVVYLSFNMQESLQRGRLPDEYVDFSERINYEGKNNRKIFVTPHVQYEYYVWNKGHNNQIISQALFPNSTIDLTEFSPAIAKKYRGLEDYTDFLIENNFGYVLEHKDYDPDKYRTKDLYFDKSKFEIVEDNKYFRVYEIKGEFFTPLVFAENADVYFYKNNNSSYKIKIKNVEGDVKLNFLELYDDRWGLYEGGNFYTHFLDIFSNELWAENHYMYKNDFANQWVIPYEEIQNLLDENGELTLTMYFKEQTKVWFVVLISLGAFIVLLVSLPYFHRKEKIK